MNGIQWSKMEQNGVEWSRMEWSGVEWSGTGYGMDMGKIQENMKKQNIVKEFQVNNFR